jgi:hypothetical protein
MSRIWMVVVALAACNTSKSSTPEPAAAHAGSAEHHGMANMPPELAKFHDVLAPRWHAAKGPQRMQDTCGAVGDFHANADALAKATQPTGANADTCTTATKALVAAVGGLDASCKANDSAGFEPAFEKVHVAFHGLLGPAAHEEHEHM